MVALAHDDVNVSVVAINERLSQRREISGRCVRTLSLFLWKKHECLSGFEPTTLSCCHMRVVLLLPAAHRKLNPLSMGPPRCEHAAREWPMISDLLCDEPHAPCKKERREEGRTAPIQPG
jgi:hypothetical protein